VASLTSNRVVLTGVHRGFRRGDEQLEVVSNLDLHLDAGEFVSLIGPSGSGKTTLINLIAGLDRPDAGTITVEGVDPYGRSVAALMPQRDALMPWRRAVANAALGLEVGGLSTSESRARVMAEWDRYGLTGFENAYPSELSGGMRQRVALLRTLVQQRPLVLLDEPFAGLDALTRGELIEWFDELRRARGDTVLLVTHDVTEAVRLSDRIVVLSPRPARVLAEFDGVPTDAADADVEGARMSLAARVLEALRQALP